MYYQINDNHTIYSMNHFHYLLFFMNEIDTYLLSLDPKMSKNNQFHVYSPPFSILSVSLTIGRLKSFPAHLLSSAYSNFLVGLLQTQKKEFALFRIELWHPEFISASFSAWISHFSHQKS